MTITAVYAGNEIVWEDSKFSTYEKFGTIDTYDGASFDQLKPLLFEADLDKPVTIIYYEDGIEKKFLSPGTPDDGTYFFATSYLIRRKFNNGKSSPDIMIKK